jgi:hypothetical protein
LWRWEVGGGWAFVIFLFFLSCLSCRGHRFELFVLMLCEEKGVFWPGDGGVFVDGYGLGGVFC